MRGRRVFAGLCAEIGRYLREPRETVWAVMLPCYLAALYLDLLWIEILLIAAMLAILIPLARASPVRMNAADWNVLAILGFEIPSLVFSMDRANSVRTTEAVIQAVAVYFTARASFRSARQLVTLALVLALAGCCIAVPGIWEFHRNATALAEAGFADLVAFRSHLILPHGRWMAGEWFTFLLLLLPFAAAVPLYLRRMGRTGLAFGATILSVPIGGALLASLSRAVFWSAILFVLATWGLMRLLEVTRTREAWIGAGLSLLLMSLILMCASAVHPGVLRAYLGTHPSQTRSNQGRLATWQRSAHLFAAHPVWGIGSSNAALALAATVEENDTFGAARGTFSLPLQLLVEKGIVGVVLYASLLILVGYRFLRGLRSDGIAESRPAALARPFVWTAPRAGRACARSGERPAAKALYCALVAGTAATLYHESVCASALSHASILALFATFLAVIASAPEILDENSSFRLSEHGAAPASPMGRT